MSAATTARKLFPGEWLVCFAVKEEAQAFTCRPHDNVRTLVTGMGRFNAERALRASLRERKLPSLVLTCGFAGGLDPALLKGAVLFEAEAKLGLAAALGEAGARPGKFFCADRVAVTAAEKRALRQTTNADAVEMESAQLQAICREQGISVATLRVILDTASEDLPIDFNALMTRDFSLDFKKLALLLLKSPSKIKSLLALQKESRHASASLAHVLDNVT
jgi:nucleoside phosphorylase